MKNFIHGRETKFSLIASLLLLVVGYADLILGGITLSAIALTLAYCVTLPFWFYQQFLRKDSPRNPGDASVEPPPYREATFAGIAVFLLYLFTLAPTTAMWDASEYIAAAYIFGVPHPPGNPLFVVLGRFFTLLPLPLGIAARVNLFAAVASAASAAIWFLVTWRLCGRILPLRWQRICVASAAALVGATAFTVWNQSVVNEKVYTLALAGIAIVSWLTIRWLDNPRSRNADALLVLAAYLSGLGYANHMAGLLALPAVVVALLIRDWRSVMRVRLIAAFAAAFFVGTTPFLTQPIRAGHNPAINEGGVSGCVTEFNISCTLSGTTVDRFLYNLNRGQYGKPSVMKRQAPIAAQLAMWWDYFSWQWWRDPQGTNAGAQNFLAVAFLLIGFVGGYAHWKHHRESFIYFGPLILLMTVGLVFYLNFKYGYSQVPELGNRVEREVRERDYFYIWSFSAWSVWVGAGLAFFWAALSRARGKVGAIGGDPRSEINRLWLRSSPVLLVALIPLFANFSAASRRNDYVTAAWARDILNSVEPYSILVVAGDNDTFPLWYAQEVENVRKDVVVVIMSLLGTDWYARQLTMRPATVYDAAKGPAVYRNVTWKQPAGPPLKMSIQEADSVPEYLTPVRPMTFEAHGISSLIDPKKLEYGVVVRSEVFLLHMIKHTAPDRPIYFSRSAGPLPSQLGLSGHLVNHGLADKLMLPDFPSAAPMDTVRVDGTGLVDYQRAASLWRDVYEAPEALALRGQWVDQPSVSIPMLYVATGFELSHLHFARGDTAAANRVFEETRRAAVAMSLPGLVEQLDAARPR